MIQCIVISTNLQINRNRPESNNVLPNTSTDEINCLIGLFPLRGLNLDPEKRKHTELISRFIWAWRHKRRGNQEKRGWTSRVSWRSQTYCRELLLTNFYWKDNLMLVSCYPKDQQLVMLLTTTHDQPVLDNAKKRLGPTKKGAMWTY